MEGAFGAARGAARGQDPERGWQGPSFAPGLSGDLPGSDHIMIVEGLDASVGGLGLLVGPGYVRAAESRTRLRRGARAAGAAAAAALIRARAAETEQAKATTSARAAAERHDAAAAAGDTKKARLERRRVAIAMVKQRLWGRRLMGAKAEAGRATTVGATLRVSNNLQAVALKRRRMASLHLEKAKREKDPDRAAAHKAEGARILREATAMEAASTRTAEAAATASRERVPATLPHGFDMASLKRILVAAKVRPAPHGRRTVTAEGDFVAALYGVDNVGYVHETLVKGATALVNKVTEIVAADTEAVRNEANAVAQAAINKGVSALPPKVAAHTTKLIKQNAAVSKMLREDATAKAKDPGPRGRKRTLVPMAPKAAKVPAPAPVRSAPPESPTVVRAEEPTVPPVAPSPSRAKTGLLVGGGLAVATALYLAFGRRAA